MLYIVYLSTVIMIITHAVLEINKRRLRNIEVNFDCRWYLEKFLNHKCIEDILKVTKAYLYNSFTNTIGITDPDSNKIVDVVTALHEAGHYKSINSNKIFNKVYIVSQIILAINRVFIIPLIILFLCLRFFCAPLFVIYFFATCLRLLIGISNEYISSRIALRFINQEWDPKNITIARNMYLVAFFDHFFLVITVSLTVLGIYIEYVS